LDPIYAILERQFTHIDTDAWLLGMPSTVQAFANVQQHFVTTFDAKAADNWQQHDVHLGWQVPPTPRHQTILFYPKAKQEALMLLDMAIAQLSRVGGSLWIVGENKGGIKSVPAIMKKRQLAGNKRDSARHCAIFEIDIPQDTSLSIPAKEHYETTIALSNEVSLASFPGVFSSGRLDVGTALLLQHLPKPTGPILDFGCGCGVIGAHLLQRYPKADMDGLDVNWLAIEATALTAKRSGVAFRTLYCANGLIDSVPRYQHIVSNPPFHEGVGTQYDTAEAFIMRSHKHLVTGGNITLVANQFLEYEPLLQKAFGNCQELAREKGFKILFARRTR